MIPKILVCAPTSDLKSYCFKEYAKQLRSFTYPNYDILLIDNSEDPTYIEKIWEAGIDAVHIEPGGSPIEYITLSQNILRNKVLNNQIAWMCMIESDIIELPTNLLEYLLMHGNEVHTFPYFIMNGAKTALCLQGITHKERYKRAVRLDPETSFSMITGEIKPIQEFKIGHGFELYATGLGVCFIHRNVLKKTEFRIDKKAPHIFSDSYFFKDLRKAGINIILDTTLIPTHYRGDAWQKDLRLIN